MKKISDLTGKKIAFLGLGIENYALAKYLLSKKIDCVRTIIDLRQKNELKSKYDELAGNGVEWMLGTKHPSDFADFDLLLRSPGWPRFELSIQKALRSGKNVSSPMQLFFSLCPTKNIIGVTGTKGKGTTASLIYEMLKAAKKKAWLGGNIGIAPFGFLEKVGADDWIVLELSSFQLEDLSSSPRISVITNLFPEHLAPADPQNPNYHKSFADYWQAKQNIFLWQKKRDKAVINLDLKKNLKGLNMRGEAFYFSSSNREADSYFIDQDLVLPNTQFQTCIMLPGEHNRSNIAAASLAASFAGVDTKSINKAIRHFHGLEHRLELADTINGVQYYNDSFATIPEGTITAMKAFDRPIILIAGGAEKKSGFKTLAHEIARREAFLILLDGDATGRLKMEARSAGLTDKKIFRAKNMSQAVKKASSLAKPGEIVLMSPACASFGMFKNYKERGAQFKEAVKNLKT